MNQNWYECITNESARYLKPSSMVCWNWESLENPSWCHFGRGSKANRTFWLPMISHSHNFSWIIFVILLIATSVFACRLVRLLSPSSRPSFFLPFFLLPQGCVRQVDTSAGGLLWARWPLSVIVLLLTPHPGRKGRSLVPYTCHWLYCHSAGVSWLWCAKDDREGPTWFMYRANRYQKPGSGFTSCILWIHTIWYQPVGVGAKLLLLQDHYFIWPICFL